jgi:cobalt-zinc-cadmium efflux system protein
MPHNHHHHTHGHLEGEARLVLSIILNLIITIAQIIGGIISGSLALLSDALHNLSDTTSLGTSLIALRIAKRRPDSRRTFGYRRAQIIGAFVNLVTLAIIAFYLIYEAIERLLDPQAIDGSIMLIVATIGLLANIFTALLLHRQSKTSLNIRSAFVHIVMDAISSVGVIIGGIVILYFGLYIVDALLTVVISLYILYHTYQLLRQTTRILMQSTPADLDYEGLLKNVRSIDGVQDVHHVHIWQLDEKTTSLEAHVVINKCDLEEMERIKDQVKKQVRDLFSINHSTLEFEFIRCDVCEDDNCYEIER